MSANKSYTFVEEGKKVQVGEIVVFVGGGKTNGKVNNWAISY